jgi:hypothetical protein
MKQLNYDYLNAKAIVLPNYDRLEFYLIGCGGTGSWLAPSLCRIARFMSKQAKKVLDRSDSTKPRYVYRE